MEFAELIATPKLDGVILHSQLDEPVEGTLCITGHHLILSSRSENSQELWLLHKNIDTVERKPNLVNQQLEGGTITLKCKDLRIITLEIAKPAEYQNVAYSIEQLSHLCDVKLSYPFFYRPMYTLLENGYTMFRPEIEFAKLLTANEEWRITNVNKDYSVCSSYSTSLVVPKQATDEQIMLSAQYRDAGRFPVLCYKHETGAALMRSSQPATNPIKRCRADEAILNLVLGKSKKGFIVDPWGGKTNSKSNSECDAHYSQWRKVSRPIGNFNHASGILDSFTKLVEACNDISCSSDKWLTRLENSGWLSLVLNSLNTACVVAQCLHQEGSPVLIHGGKGLDATLIVTSLVQIILNPDCRTVRGMQALIEREWLQGGHPFATRHKQASYTSAQNRQKTSGATFVLFLDCVFQLYSQFPCSFEYHSHFLITLFEHSYFSQYGTFLGDSECERAELQVFTRTTSLWSNLNRPDVMKSLLNSIYEPNAAVIWPSVAPISLTLWSDLYLRFVIDQSLSKKVFHHVQSLISQEKELRSKVLKLRRQLLDLLKEYQEMQKHTANHSEDNSNNNHNSSTSLLNDSANGAN